MDHLDTDSWTIISIYGGSVNAAAIDENGGIHIINEECVRTKCTSIYYLPYNRLCISVAFQNDFIIGLSSDGIVYELTDYENGFVEIEEIDQNCISISGVANHCIAVCDDGSVFVRGSNENGQLGIGKNKKQIDNFIQISGLTNNEIVDAFAGIFHSLFINRSGKVLSCGYDGFGELLQNRYQSGTNTFMPKNSSITYGACFCIAGKQISVVFVNCNPPVNSPNKKIELAAAYPYPIMIESNTMQNENDSLQAENYRLQAENGSLKAQISSINETNVLWQKAYNSQKIENENLKKEIEQLKSLKSIENNSLRTQISSLQKTNTLLQKNVNSQRIENNKLKSEYEKLKSYKLTENNSLKAQILSLQKTSTLLQKTVNSQRIENAKLKSENEKLESQENDEILKLKNEIVKLKNDAILKKNNKELKDELKEKEKTENDNAISNDDEIEVVDDDDDDDDDYDINIEDYDDDDFK